MNETQRKAIEKASAEAVARLASQDELGHVAALTPLPGPLREAFALAQDIEVGGYKVRPLVDMDFEVLAALNHPLERMYKQALSGLDPSDVFLPTGLPMWQAAWVFTRDPDESEQVLSNPDGSNELSRLARKEFGKLQTKALGAIYLAIMKQVEVNSSTAVKYEPAKAEGEAAKAAQNPSSPLLRMTG